MDVHRLLCEDSVDQRVLELLAAKREAFDEYARRSDMANAAPDAVDATSQAELRHAIVAAERDAAQGGVTAVRSPLPVSNCRAINIRWICQA